MQHKVTAQIGSSSISIETGKIAKLADGAVVVSSGDTIVMASAVSATSIKEGQDWFPLTVDYREKPSAAGKFPGGFIKREGRPTTKETLTARMIDRPIRPLFPLGYFDEVLIQVLVLSADGQNDPDVLSMIGASAALACTSTARGTERACGDEVIGRPRESSRSYYAYSSSRPWARTSWAASSR